MTLRRKPPVMHYELSSGTSYLFDRSIADELTDPISRALEQSEAERSYMPVDETALEICSDTTAGKDGNGVFEIANRYPLGGGVVPVGSTLYLGAVACELSCAPLAWRTVFGRYLHSSAQAPRLASCSAPGLMPRELPWVVGYFGPITKHLTESENQEVELVIRLTSLITLGRCEAMHEAALEAGEIFLPDSIRYIELQNWEDHE
ncbi:hypothetical protein GALL_372870 [mine drainage metagenome]|uniref:Uncharacterized protein n=1 Tax=mine drainage metagenome TaxID=410659 RepID=A0A1J5QCL7_9ZZZZ